MWALYGIIVRMEMLFFCDNTKNSFVKGIQSLVEDRGKLSLMKSESLKLSERFNIAKIDEWFSMLSST